MDSIFNVLNEKTPTDFDQQLPQDKECGYIREVRTDDINSLGEDITGAPPEEGWLAFFDFQGEMRYWSYDQLNLTMALEENNCLIYQVH